MKMAAHRTGEYMLRAELHTSQYTHIGTRFR